MDGDFQERRKRAERAGERFGRFAGEAVKGTLLGLGLIFAAILVLRAF